MEKSIWHEGNPANQGLYWVQVRSGLGHLTVGYTAAFFNGRGRWYYPDSCSKTVYYWAYIQEAPNPEGYIYEDGYDRLPCVSADELVGDLSTTIGRG